MRIIGIDPSLSCTGWAIIEDGKLIQYGTIKTKAKTEFIKRLDIITYETYELFHNLKTDYIAIEDIFVYGRKSMQTPIKLAKVHGAILASIFCHRPLLDTIKIYPPSTVKQSVTGKGNASKEQVMKMIKIMSGYQGKSDDESDAIAVALTCEKELTNERNL